MDSRQGDFSIAAEEDSEGVVFSVWVVPRSSVTRVSGTRDGAVRIRVTAPPVGGAANKELIRHLAKLLGTSRSQVEILSGHRSRLKRVRATGVAAPEVQARLLSGAGKPETASENA